MHIIDTHTHFPGRLLGAAPRPIAELRAEFEADGLSGAWIMTVDGLLREPGPHNDLLALAVHQSLDFFIPFCTVNPHDGVESAVRELERCQRELGMRGLKLHPWIQAFSMTNEAVVPILQAAGRLGMPVLLHDGSPPYSSPLQIAWAAEQAPKTITILGHAGLEDLWEDAIIACRRHDNIHLCLCSGSSGYVAQIIRRCPHERLLFGSDGGFGEGLVSGAIMKLRAACPNAGLFERIVWENPQRLLPLAGAAPARGGSVGAAAQ